MKNNHLALIVLNYNGINLLKECLDSILKQNYQHFDIYLADDASTDDSLKFIKKNYSRVKIISSSKNLGPAGISNFAGMKLKKYKYLIFLSNDILLDKNCIKYLHQSVNLDSSVGICSSVLIKYGQKQIPTNKIDNAGVNIDIFGFIQPNCRDIPFNKLPKSIINTFASCGTSFIINNQIFRKLNGFDKKYWGLSDDIDLSWRVRLLGYQVIVNPNSFLYHRQSVTLGKNKWAKNRYFSERNILRMLIKNYSLSSLLFIMPLYFFLELLEILFFLTTLKPQMSFSILKAFWWNIKNLKDTLSQRKHIQSIRTISEKNIFSRLYKGSFKIKILPDIL